MPEEQTAIYYAGGETIDKIEMLPQCDTVKEKGYEILSSEQEKIPANYVTLTDEDDIKKMNLLLEKLEENEDVNDVYHNWENAED